METTNYKMIGSHTLRNAEMIIFRKVSYRRKSIFNVVVAPFGCSMFIVGVLIVARIVDDDDKHGNVDHNNDSSKTICSVQHIMCEWPLIILGLCSCKSS